MSMSRQALCLIRRLSRPASVSQPQRAVVACDIAPGRFFLSPLGGHEGDGRTSASWFSTSRRYQVEDVRVSLWDKNGLNCAFGKSFASMASDPMRVVKEAEDQEISTDIAVGTSDSGNKDAPTQVEGSQVTAGSQSRPVMLYDPNRITVLAAKMSRTLVGDRMSHLLQTDKPQEVQVLYREWMKGLNARGLPNKPDTHIINVVLQSMANTGASLKAMEAFLEDAIKTHNVIPTRTTYTHFLKPAFREKDVEFVEKLVNRMEKSDMEKQKPHAEFYNVIIVLKAAERKVRQAMEVLKTMLAKGFKPGRLAYNSILRACAKQKYTRDAVQILTVTKNYVMHPLIVIFVELLVAAVEEEDIDLMLLALDEINLQRHHVDEGTLLTVLDLAARSGYTLVTEKAWQMLLKSLGPETPSVPCHLARMHAYATARNFTSAIRAVQELEVAYSGRVGAAPDLPAPENDAHLCPFTSLQPLVLAFSQNVPTLDQSYNLLEQMHTNGEAVSIACLNAVILSCANLWDMSRGYETFEAITEKFGLRPNTHSYNALIHCFGAVKQHEYAVKTFESMELNGVPANQRTYEVMVDACILVKDAAGALEYLKKMVDKGYKPQREQLVRMYRRSQRAGFQEGWRWTRATIKTLGYRDVEYGSINRRIINDFGHDTSNELRVRRAQLQG